MILDPLSAKRPEPKPVVTASLYVSGKYMTEGTLDQMNSMFDQECASHSAVVELREITKQGERSIRRRSQ